MEAVATTLQYYIFAFLERLGYEFFIFRDGLLGRFATSDLGVSGALPFEVRSQDGAIGGVAPGVLGLDGRCGTHRSSGFPSLLGRTLLHG